MDAYVKIPVGFLVEVTFITMSFLHVGLQTNVTQEWSCGHDISFFGWTCETDALTADTNFSFIKHVEPSMKSRPVIQCRNRDQESEFVTEKAAPHLSGRIAIVGCLFRAWRQTTFRGLYNVTRLDLSSNDATSLEAGAFTTLESLKELNIDGSRIGVLVSRSFYAMDTLIKLTLQRNEITTIEPNAFNLSQLLSLDLSYNNLTIINSTEFYGIPRLLFLNLKYNKLTVVGNKPFIQLSGLLSLRLDWNSIRYLASDTFTNLLQVQQIILDGNDLGYIENDTFSCLPRLLKVSLKNNSLTSMDKASLRNKPGDEQCRMGRLVTITMDDNSLEIVPDAFSQLQSRNIFVRKLSLDNNRIYMVAPRAFSGLPNIRDLSMRNNLLTLLMPEAFYQMPLLSKLELSNNRIKYLPSDIFQPDNLKYLYLENNHLTRLSSSFLHVHAGPLYFCNLSNNYISYISDDATMDLLQIETLDLSGNLISVFPSVDYAQLLQRNRIHTKYLYLQRNKLWYLPFKISFLKELVILDVSNNFIAYVASEIFTKLERLSFTNLQNNSIETLGKDSLEISAHVPVKPQVLLGGNPLKCNCDGMEWILDTPSDPGVANIGDLYKVTCEHVILETGLRQKSNVVAVPKERFLCELPYICDMACGDWCVDQYVGCTYMCPDHCSCYVSENYITTYMVCVGNFSIIETVLKPGTNVLIMDNNDVTHLTENSFVNATLNLRNISLDSNMLVHIERGAFLELGNLTYLNLRNNYLGQIHSYTFEGLTRLKELDMRNNKLLAISGEVSFLSLEILHLQGNHLEKICFRCLAPNSSFIHSLYLKDNPWRCDCEFGSEFQRWIASTVSLVRDSSGLYCASGTQYSGYRVMDAPFEDCNVVVEVETNFILVIILCIIFGCIAVSSALVYRFKEFIKVVLYNHCGIRCGGIISGFEKKFDAFLSYSSKDAKYVRVLFNELENKPPHYKLCFHHRDWLVGPAVAENIIDSVSNCRRTIILISQNFLDSEWCYLEFQAAHNQFLRDKTTVPIVIIIGDQVPEVKDTELRYYIQTHTYLRWNDHWFWHKLRYAMPDHPVDDSKGIEVTDDTPV